MLYQMFIYMLVVVKILTVWSHIPPYLGTAPLILYLTCYSVYLVVCKM